MKNKSLILNGIFNFVRTVIGAIFPVVTFAYASRILGATGLGQVNFAKALSYYFVLFASLGISNYGIREVASVREDVNKRSQIIMEIFSLNVIFTLLSLIVYIGVILFVPSLFKYRILLLICIFWIVISPLSMEWLYGAMEDFKYITIRTIVFQFISLGLLFTLVKDKSDVTEYMFVTIFSCCASYILNFFNVKKYVRLKEIKRLNLRKHLKPVFILFALSLSINIYNGIDTVMLGFFKDDYTVGIYTAASKVNRLVVTIITSILAVLLPRLSYYISNNNKDKFYELVRQAFNILLMFSIPSVMGMILLNYNILYIFSGSGYESANIPMLIMNPIIALIPINTLINMQIFIPLKKEKLILRSTGTSVIVNIIVNSICIPKYGTIGAAVGSVLAESMGLIVSMSFAKRYFSIRQMFANIWQYVVASVLFIPISYFIKEAFSNIYIQTFLVLSVCFVEYFVALKVLRNTYLDLLFGKVISLFRRKRV